MENLYSPKAQEQSSIYINQSGYSLLEVLLAVAILTIGMLATGSLALGIINGNSVSKKVTTAATLAQDKIESIREAGFSGLPSSDSTEVEDYGHIQYIIGGDSADYSSYRRITAIQVNTPMAGMKTATVSMFWKAGTNPLTFRIYLSQ